MKTGYVYGFFSEESTPKKYKWHICIDPDQNSFLYINSEPYFSSEMQITKQDWPEMKEEVSYISCVTLIDYTDAQMGKYKIKDRGSLSKDCIDELYEFIDNSVTMEQDDIDDICISLGPLIST